MVVDVRHLRVQGIEHVQKHGLGVTDNLEIKGLAVGDGEAPAPVRRWSSMERPVFLKGLRALAVQKVAVVNRARVLHP